MWSFWERTLSRKGPLKDASRRSLLHPPSHYHSFCHRFHKHLTTDASRSRQIRRYSTSDVWDFWAQFCCLISQIVCSRRSRRQLVPEVDGVLRSAHQQVEHVCSHGQEARGSGCGDIQQLPVCRRRTRRPRVQPLFQTLRLCWEVSKRFFSGENAQTQECCVSGFRLQLMEFGRGWRSWLSHNITKGS